MSPKQADTKERIFETAVELFATRGYHATSIRDLAKAVGIKESSIYNHFSGKSAILDAILEYQMEGFRSLGENIRVPALEDPSIHDALTLWMSASQAYVQYQPPLSEKISRILLNEMFLHEKCREFVLEIMFNIQKDITEKLLVELQRRGLIRDIDIHETALEYVYMIHGMDVENRLLLLEGHDPLALRQKLFDHVRHFIQGISKD